MNLNPRAIALQGIGFSPLLVAVQGLLPPNTSSGGIWRQREHFRRLLAEQQALDEAKRERIAAEAALAALEIEAQAAAARAEALKRVRDRAKAHRQLQAGLLSARARLETAEAAVAAAEIVLQAAQIEEIEVEAPQARRDRMNRRRAAVLAALLLLDD